MAGATDDRTSGTGDRGELRAAHGDREHVIGVLTTAFVRGMLDKDEFDQRVSVTFASRTYAELATVTVDLPANLPAAAPVPGPAAVQEEGWLTMKRAVIISACMLVPTALATVIGMVLSNPYDNGAQLMLPIFAFFVATVISGPLISEARYRRRSRARPPQAPAPGAGSRPARGSQAGPGIPGRPPAAFPWPS